MLTSDYFETIGRLIYQCSLLESRICMCLVSLGDRNTDHFSSNQWAMEIKQFHFTDKTEADLARIAQDMPSNLADLFRKDIGKAKSLISKRNDIVSCLWDESSRYSVRQIEDSVKEMKLLTAEFEAVCVVGKGLGAS